MAEADSISSATVNQDLHPGLRRARIAARVAAENRGREIVILDLRELTCMFDYFVLVSGASRRQLHAISEEIDRVLRTNSATTGWASRATKKAAGFSWTTAMS